MPEDKTFDIVSEQERIPRARRKKDGFNRMDVVQAFNNAFQIMGGVPRLALWANQNPDKFYPLYAKLMPSTSVNISTEGNRLIIEHATPTTPLDDFTGVMGYAPPGQPGGEEPEDAPIKRMTPNAD